MQRKQLLIAASILIVAAIACVVMGYTSFAMGVAAVGTVVGVAALTRRG